MKAYFLHLKSLFIHVGIDRHADTKHTVFGKPILINAHPCTAGQLPKKKLSWFWSDTSGQEIPNLHDSITQYYCAV